MSQRTSPGRFQRTMEEQSSPTMWWRRRTWRQHQWVPVAASNKKPSLMAMYLMEGIQYLFRVAAENQFGRSDYVVTKTPIKAIDPLCECP